MDLPEVRTGVGAARHAVRPLQSEARAHFARSVPVYPWRCVVTSDKVICGHTATGSSGAFTCYLRPGHEGLHAETFRLRDGATSTTNWGDDGLAPWATTDPRANRKAMTS